MLPFDLHVLGMPPAFNLSQDQTLQFNLFYSILRNYSPFAAVPRLVRKYHIDRLKPIDPALKLPNVDCG